MDRLECLGREKFEFGDRLAVVRVPAEVDIAPKGEGEFFQVVVG
jgi:hypothetical protein